MKFFQSLEVPEKFTNPVLTVGNYDGLHRGHRAIIEMVKAYAGSMCGTSMLMTFNPHPLSVLRPDNHLGQLTPLSVKKRLVEETGIDVLFVIPFTEEFSSTTPESFILDVLVGMLGIKGLIVGYDFRFGKGGRGDTAMLREFSERSGFFFHMVDAIGLHGEKVGSNRIRRLILDGEVAKAGLLLGRPYMIQGIVAKGQGRGVHLGYPTLNLSTTFEIIPRRGVYVTEVEFGRRRFPSVTNVGYNPTFDGRELTIETHVLSFSGDLYGQEVALYFHEKIRDEVRFGNVEDLKSRIGMDVTMARTYFDDRAAG